MKDNLKKQGESMKESKKFSKEDVVKEYLEDKGTEPSWTNKKFKEMSQDELNEYKKYQKRLKRKAKKQKKELIEKEIPKTVKKDLEKEGVKEEMSDEEKYKLVKYTADKIREEESGVTPKEKEEKEKIERENKLIGDYIKKYRISTTEGLNYAIEHDPKFKTFLEKIGRLKQLYSGSYLKELQRERENFNKEIEEEAQKDKKGKEKKRFYRKTKNKKLETNRFEDSKKVFDIEPYRNKKHEKKGYILCIYLRKNGIAEPRYVKMDEVGQIKVDGYVYHERDATYRIGKKNDPVLFIMEGALVPLSKETFKEQLAFDYAEAQKLIIKGIEQAEVVKAGGLEDKVNNPLKLPKWAVGVGIAVIIGLYAFFGGWI